MKLPILAGILGVVIVGGLIALLAIPAPEPEEVPGTVEAEGLVVSVNVEQAAFDGPVIVTLQTDAGERSISVPSMGLPLCPAFANIADVYTLAKDDQISVRGTLGEDGSITPCEDASHYLRAYGTIGDQAFGYEFSYRKGPDGYITKEDTESAHPDYLAGVALFNAEEYEAFLESTEAREGPPALRLRVYNNPEKLDAPAWSLKHSGETNETLALSEPKEEVVGGANAVFFTTDGLYPTDTYIVAHDSKIYVLMGSYLDKDSSMYKDFQELVASFSFPAL